MIGKIWRSPFGKDGSPETAGTWTTVAKWFLETKRKSKLPIALPKEICSSYSFCISFLIHEICKRGFHIPLLYNFLTENLIKQQWLTEQPLPNISKSRIHYHYYVLFHTSITAQFFFNPSLIKKFHLVGNIYLTDDHKLCIGHMQ